MNRLKPSPESGFSLPEVMVSALLLAMVVANSAQIYFRSGKNVNASTLRDSVYARIAADIEALRGETWRWACMDGAACYSEKNNGQGLNYKTAGIPNSNGTMDAGPYAYACMTNTLASAMQNEYASDQAKNDMLTNRLLEVTSDTRSPLYLYRNKIKIQRTVVIDPEDSNSFRLTYLAVNPASSQTPPPVKVEVNTVLVPQAAGWCP